MAKRGKPARRLPAARKTPTRRKRAPPDADLKKEIATLRRELAEALERQTATSEVLQVISSTPGELEPVFQSLLENATRVCGAKFGTMALLEGDAVRRAALYNVPLAYVDALGTPTFRPHPMGGLGQVIRTKQVAHIADLRTNRGYLEGDPAIVALSDLAGARTFVVVPMLKDAKLVGMIAVYRQEVRPFTDKQIELLSNFAKQAVIAIENTRLLKELRESLQQQTATADVLKVISRSVFDLQAVLDALVKSAAQLCDTDRAVLTRKQGDRYYRAALHGFPDEAIAEMKSVPVDLESGMIVARALRDCAVVHVADVNADPEYPGSPAQTLGGVRTVLSVPLIREGQPIGAISVSRTRVEPFTEKQIELIRTFADQAVIAIENVRLFDEVQARTLELSESLEQQTATTEVLSVISSLAGELEPVFDKMLENATRVCGANFGTMNLVQDGVITRVASYNVPSAYADAPDTKSFRPHPKSSLGQVIANKEAHHILDLLDSPAYLDGDPAVTSIVRNAGARSLATVPMLRDTELIGTISVYGQEVRPFTVKQIELLSNFAKQAVIAIENTRLLKELRESLQQQTATADVLKVISRSTIDLQTVLDTLVELAVRLCEANIGQIALPNEAGYFQTQAHCGFTAELKEELERIPFKPGRESVTGRALLERKTVQILDAQTDPEYKLSKAQRLGGYRSLIGTPLLREGVPIGVFGLSRNSVRPFTDKQMALLTTFADQAVIAIENARLFDEVQAKTRDLSEALTYQTGSSKVLGVIASSPTDVGPVLKAIVESACELCDAYDAVVRLKVGDDLVASAHHGPIPADTKKWRINRNWTAGRAIIDKKPVHVHDVLSADGDEFPESREIARHQGHRTVLSVPLLREGESIGAIILRRNEVHPFSNKQIALLQTFADQAVIAIENVRLFDEVQERTEDLRESLQQQTATADVLKVISGSPGELEPVFQAMLENATRICEAKFSNLFLREGDAFRAVALYGEPAYVESWQREPLIVLRDHPGVPLDRLARTNEVLHIHDLTAEPPYIEGDRRMIALVEFCGRPDDAPRTNAQGERADRGHRHIPRGGARVYR